MAKETYQIEKFHSTVDAFTFAFSFLYRQERPTEKDGDYHMSFSKKHINLERSNPADTIEVATFLKHKSGIEESDNHIKKEFIYVCEFKWQPYRKIKEFKNSDEITYEGLETINTGHLLFMLKWNADFSCWERVPMLACSNASSHNEAANWMLQECVENGSDVTEHRSLYRYLSNQGILSCFYSEVLSKLSQSDQYGRFTRNAKINTGMILVGWYIVIGFGFLYLFDAEYRNILWGIISILFGGGMAWIAHKKKPNWKGYPWNW